MRKGKFFEYIYTQSINKLSELLPLPHSRGRTICYSDKLLHDTEVSTNLPTVIPETDLKSTQ